MSDNHDWFSEKTKTIIVVVTMSILVGGMGWGYYEMHQWKAERMEQQHDKAD